jgi:hypothetical protein
MRLLIDTAGTGIQNWKLDRHHPAQPYLTRLAVFSDDPSFGPPICSLTWAPVRIEEKAWEFYGIRDKDLADAGQPSGIFSLFLDLLGRANSVAGYSVNSHKRLLDRTARNLGLPDIQWPHSICLMQLAAPIVQARRERGRWVWPKMDVAYRHFAGTDLPRPADPLAAGIELIKAAAVINAGIERHGIGVPPAGGDGG